MKKTIVLFLLTVFSSVLMHAEGAGMSSRAETGDSLMAYFRSLPLNADRCRQECLSYLANIEYSWSSSILDMAIEDSRAIDDTVHLSYGLYYSIMALGDKCDTSKVNPLLGELKSLFPDKEAQLNYFRSMSWINDAYIESMNLEAAFSQLEVIEREAQECGLHSGLLIAWTQRANIYMKTGRYEEAIDILSIVAGDENCTDTERLSAYLSIYQASVLKKDYDGALHALDEAMTYLDKCIVESGNTDRKVDDTNYLLLESCYADIWCVLKNPEKLKERLENMERYYVDSYHSTSYLQYHRLYASYYAMVGRLYDAENELEKCFSYCDATGSGSDVMDLMVLKSEVMYLQGKKDSACAVYADYLRETESFYSLSMKQQREKVAADFYFKKGYAGREQFVNWLLRMVLDILIAGILIFTLLLFWKSRIVMQERRVSFELNRSYLAAEQANKDREEILLKIRESISQPLSIVLHDAELINSGKQLDPETKTALHTRINENAVVLNTIISDFLNKARAAAGKSSI